LKFHPRFSGNRDSRENLKKVLALVLAFACAFTMFAGAAFTDQADIKASEAVDTLVALGVVNGYDDGSFKPNGTVTRAEMAKMIYVLRTGNSDASAYNDDKTSFTDIGSHWARGYIKYCQSLGIIAGKSNTKFCPNDKVTAQEAAKMLLVTLGYNAEKAGLTGASWASKTNALADENGLLEDVNTSFTAACPRQYAAQLIYNAIDAHTVVMRDGEYTNMTLLGDDYLPTVGKKYMGLVTENVILTGVKKEDGKSTYQVDVAAITGETTPQSTSFTKVEKDYSALVGQKIKLLHKDNKKDVVYGISVNSDVKTAKIIVGDLDAFAGTVSEVKANSVTYKLASEASSVKIGTNHKTEIAKLSDLSNGSALTVKEVPADSKTYKLDKATELTLIDNDGNGKYESITATPHFVGKVTYKGADSITVNNGLGNQDNDDVAISKEVKKDDFVDVTPKAYSVEDKFTLTKLDVVEGTAQAIRKNGSEVRIDSTWYTDIAGATNKFAADSKYKLAVLNGYVYDTDGKTSTDPADYVYVEKAAAGSGLDSDSLIANLYFSDGKSVKNATINSVDDDDVVSTTPASGEIAIAVAAGKITGKLCTFTEDGGEYDLDVVAAKGNFDDYAADLNKYEDKQLQGSKKFEIADDATVFVDAKDGVKVLTGKAVKAWGDDAKTLSAGQALTLKTNGFQYVQIGAIKMSVDLPDADNDTVYGYLTEDVSSTKSGNTTYYEFTVWNGTTAEPVVLTAKSSNVTNASSISKGDLIEYKVVEGNTINSVKEISATKITTSTAVTKDKTFYEAAVKAYDGKKIMFTKDSTGKKYDIDSDTYKLFINSKDTKGAQGDIEIAQDAADNDATHDNQILNAIFAVDSDGDVIAIIIDVNGDMGNNNDKVAKD